MSKLSKLREAIEHLEAAEVLMLDARRAFGQFTLQYDSLTYHADHASKAADAVRSTLNQVEFGIYQAAQQSVHPTLLEDQQNFDLQGKTVARGTVKFDKPQSG
jgi:hypothetical protein